MIRVRAVGKRDCPLPGPDAVVRVTVGRTASGPMKRKSERASEAIRARRRAGLWRGARTGLIASFMNRLFLFLAALLLGAAPAAADILVDNVNG